MKGVRPRTPPPSDSVLLLLIFVVGSMLSPYFLEDAEEEDVDRVVLRPIVL